METVLWSHLVQDKISFCESTFYLCSLGFTCGFCLLSVPFFWEFSPTVGQVKLHLFFKSHQKLSVSSSSTHKTLNQGKPKKVLQTDLPFLSLLAEMWEKWSCFLLLWYLITRRRNIRNAFFFFFLKNNQSFFENIEGQCLSALFLLMWWEILDF